MKRLIAPSLALLLVLAGSPVTLGSEAETPLSFVRSGQYGNGYTADIALGDLDGDGDLDAVFSNMSADACEVWLNDGSGGFRNSYQRLGYAAHGVGIGDLDADGDLDLFVARASTDTASTVYLNNGSGRFASTGQDLGDRTIAANFITLVDVEGDGDLDAAVYYAHRYCLLYLNNGAGSFSRGARVDGYSVWGDLDGDGDVDAISWVESYTVRRNVGGGVFQDIARIAAPANIIMGCAALLDIENDGDLDLVGTWDLSADVPLVVLRNDGSGTFTYEPETRTSGGLGSLVVGDLNNDGFADLFIRGCRTPDVLALNDGHGGFVDSGLSWPTHDVPGSGGVGDLDRDGDLDLFLAQFHNAPNEVWLNAAAR